MLLNVGLLNQSVLNGYGELQELSGVATSTGSSTASGSITKLIQASAEGAASISALASLDVPLAVLFGQIQAAVSTSASALIVKNLGASAAASASSANADVTLAKNLASTAAGTAVVASSASLTKNLAANAETTAVATALVSVTKSLGASASATAETLAQADLAKNLATSASAAATVSANSLTLTKPLSAALGATALIAPALGLIKTISGSGSVGTALQLAAPMTLIKSMASAQSNSPQNTGTQMMLNDAQLNMATLNSNSVIFIGAQGVAVVSGNVYSFPTFASLSLAIQTSTISSTASTGSISLAVVVSYFDSYREAA